MKPSKTMDDVQAIILTKTVGELHEIAVVAQKNPKTATLHAQLFINAMHGVSLKEQRGQSIDPHIITAIGMVFAQHCIELLSRGIDPLTNTPNNKLEIN